MKYLVDPKEPILNIEGDPVLINAAPRLVLDSKPPRMETPEEAKERADRDPEPLLFRDVVYKLVDNWEPDEKPGDKEKTMAFTIQLALFDRAHPIAELTREETDFIRARNHKLSPVLWHGRITQILDQAEIEAKDREKLEIEKLERAVQGAGGDARDLDDDE